MKLCRNILIRLLVAVVIISAWLVPPGFCQETEDFQIFISGFNAYQQKNYPAAIERMNEVLQKYPDTSLRDMTIFWLSRSYFKAGNQHEAARFMSQFSREYPDNPLKSTVEEELLDLAARYDKGEKLPGGAPAAKVAEKQGDPQAKAGKERIAQEKAEPAAKTAEAERVAAEKAAMEAETARMAAAGKKEERPKAVQAERVQPEGQRLAEEKARAEKAALREKAIAQYKSIIEKYPESKAAAVAVAKLQELGVAVALTPKRPEAGPRPAEQPENAQVLRLEVAQYAGLEFKLLDRPNSFDVARRISLPFEIINRGNGKDTFYLESGFPKEFNADFTPAGAPGQAINQTPLLAPGEGFKGVVNLTIPAASIDGLRISHPVKAASRFMGEASQSREIGIIAAAPLLRAVLKTEKTRPLPGEKVIYHIALLNVGSTAAQDVTLRLNFPPQMEPLDHAAAGFRQEMKAALVQDGLRLKSGESREFSVSFQLKDDSLAGQELLTRAELFNNPLKTRGTFLSNAAHVQAQRGITVRSASERIVIIPGQTVTLPFVVTNTGNLREKFAIASTLKGAREASIFHDINRDGVRQADEPAITEIGPLGPKEEAAIVMQIKTPRDAVDGAEGSVQLGFASEGDSSRTASASASLVYSRPVLQMAMAGRDERLRPGEVSSFDLIITNRGSNIARVVELQSAWPEQLELVAVEPANGPVASGNILWKFNELGAGEKRTIKVSFRVKPGTGAGTNVQVRNVLKYEDQQGNWY